MKTFLDPLLPPALFALWSGGSLFLVRLLYRCRDRHSFFGKGAAKPKARTLLVGANDQGETIAREILRELDSPRTIVGIVDDNPDLLSTRLHGVPLLGRIADIPKLVRKHQIDEVLLAMAFAEGKEIRRVYEFCTEAGVRACTIPGVHDLISGRAVNYQIRDIDVADLLPRKPAIIENDGSLDYVRNKVVLITGGGGSIGGELARQISRLGPKRLIILGKGENSIFEVQKQIQFSKLPKPDCFVGDVRSAKHIEEAFSRYEPEIVFHAAAHKHFLLMEENPSEAIENNVGGTLNVLQVAIRHEAEKFILISTDKAVHPSTIMGATKCLAEQIVRAHAGSGTDCAIVRFGNVLGSRGSLVPLLKMQIALGGPIQVTDPEMRRFFMTIPEAVHLVVHAGSRGKQGEVFILDMGEPVRILDLVEDVIRLHGHEPGKTIEIEFTGARPGEKLNEVIVRDDSKLKPTSHPSIRVIEAGSPTPWNVLRSDIDALLELCNSGENHLIRERLMALAAEAQLDRPREGAFLL